MLQFNNHSVLPWSFSDGDVIDGHGEKVCLTGVALATGAVWQEAKDNSAFLSEAVCSYYADKAAIAELVDSLKWFVSRVDAGEVKSTRTYNRYKRLIQKHGGVEAQTGGANGQHTTSETDRARDQ